jgi:hypothetical protein
MAKIHALDVDVKSAKNCISCFNSLLKRLYPLEKLEWLEQALVARVYLTGKHSQTQKAEGVKDMGRLLDGISPIVTHPTEVRRNISIPLSNRATCSVQMVPSPASLSRYYGKYQTHSSRNDNSKMLFPGVLQLTMISLINLPPTTPKSKGTPSIFPT